MTIRRARSGSEKEWSPGAAGPLLKAEDDRDREWWDGIEPSWQDLSLCSQTDPEAFFPEKGGSTREAKAVCRSCEVRAECLEYALEHGERFGIWGGLSERERRRLVPASAEGTGPRLCRRQLHDIDENRGSGGRCLACQRDADARVRAAERVARTGSSSPQSGRRLAA